MANGKYAKYVPSAIFRVRAKSDPFWQEIGVVLLIKVDAPFSQEIGVVGLRMVVLMGSDEEDEFLWVSMGSDAWFVSIALPIRTHSNTLEPICLRI